MLLVHYYGFSYFQLYELPSTPSSICLPRSTNVSESTHSTSSTLCLKSYSLLQVLFLGPDLTNPKRQLIKR